MSFARLSFAAVLLSGTAVMASAAPAMAQDAASDAATSPGEAVEEGGQIIVTARRREERLVDVPIAVTAFSAEELARRGALDITDVAQSVPNVTLHHRILRFELYSCQRRRSTRCRCFLVSFSSQAPLLVRSPSKNKA